MTNFTVRPSSGSSIRASAPVPDPGEVDEVFEVPLAFVLDPANLQVHGRAWQGAFRRYYVIPYGPHYIWGATARMLKALSDRVLAVTRIAAPWLAAPATQAVCGALTAAGHRALPVGGCVRNTLLGRPVADIDIATDARCRRR